MYLAAFLCCLRSDEVLSLPVENVQYHPLQFNRLDIHLNKRKNRQEDITPFALYFNEETPVWLCPIRAYINYVMVMMEAAGEDYVRFMTEGASTFFRDIDTRGRIDFQRNMVLHIYMI